MAIVIGDMQVDVSDRTQQQQRRGGADEGGGGDEGGGESQPSPEELERVWRQQHERYERVRAH